jgi:hypothetical protein
MYFRFNVDEYNDADETGKRKLIADAVDENLPPDSAMAADATLRSSIKNALWSRINIYIALNLMIAGKTCEADAPLNMGGRWVVQFE